MTIITPVGTSIFENYFKDGNNSQRGKYNLLREQEQRQASTAHVWEMFNSDIDVLRDSLISWSKKYGITSAAELESLFLLRDSLPDKSVKVHLLATDTALSRLAAEILVQLMTGVEGFQVFFDPEKDGIMALQVENDMSFRQQGMPNLIKRLDEIWGGHADVAVNFTGGFKAAIPYLTIWAQVHNIPLYYKFESTDCLIKIPQSPISINWGVFRKYAFVVSDLAETIEDWEHYKRQNKVEDDFPDCIEFIEIDNKKVAALNAVGEMFRYMSDQYFVTQVSTASSFFKNRGDKQNIEQALQKLWYLILTRFDVTLKDSTEILQNTIHSLGEKDDLRHGPCPAKGVFIYKQRGTPEIRLVYTPIIEGGQLYFKLFDFKIGSFNHPKYLEEFKKKYKEIKNLDFVDIPIRKEA